MASRSCLITGASTGIGEACALRLASVLEHALTSVTPRPRYLVGAEAKLRARVRPFVPDRLRDRLFTRVLGLPARDSVEGSVC